MSRYRVRINEGDRFGRWTVISEQFAINESSHSLCRCDCGSVRSVVCYSLTSGRSAGCGCDLNRKSHGHNSRTYTSPTYYSWCAMKSRCTNPNTHGYHNYGGRGIAVCDRWLKSFSAFLADMGERPADADSIERINNDGNYEPGNCRWATQKEQNCNMRTNVVIEINGEKACLAEWCERTGMKSTTVGMRIKRGYDPVRAVLEPVQ